MLKTVWLLMLISGIVLIILGIILILVFRVPYLIGEVNGRNAEKQIKYLRSINVSNTTNNLFVDAEETNMVELPIKDFKKDIKLVSDSTDIVGNTDESSINTGYMNSVDSTTFMGEDVDATSILATNDVSNLGVKHSVILLKEQTSLNINI